MPDSDFRLFDCDQHYYETRDSFTRYIEPAFADQAVRPVRQDDGSEIVMVGERPLTFLLGHDLYDTAGAPGSLKEKLIAMKKGGGDMAYGGIPMRPEWRDREKRLALMDDQGVEGCLMFPNVAVAVEHFMATDAQLYANLRALNRWIEDDWGYSHRDRIFAPPMLSLRNLEMAVAELDRVLAVGVRCITLKAGPAYGRNPADPYFDPFWSRVNEAGISVAFHLGECGYNETNSPFWGEAPNPPNFEMSAFQWAHNYCDRPIMETLSAFVYANFFEVFPKIRLISVEHGCEWVPYLLRRLDKMRGMGRGGPWIRGPLRERPSAIFKRHIRVTPFFEDDTPKVVEEIGTAECIVLGSDWPHPEGLEHPGDFFGSIEGLSDSQIRDIMRDTGRALVAAA